MNKDFLVVLLEKDIRELELLTEGFETLEVFPKPILLLARQKAENIIKYLDELENLKAAAEVKKEPEIIQTQEEPSKNEIELTPENNLESVDEKTKEEELIISEIIDEKEITEEVVAEEEPAEFVEDIKDYGISEKVVEEEPVEEKFVETEEKSEVRNPKSEEVVKSEPLNPKPETITINHSEESENTLNSINENIKIDDIRSAINIGDRFRFQRELFGGNGEVMNKTISYLNQLAKYDEAASFLNNKFGWEKDNQHAEDFLSIVRRRYL